MIDAKKVENWMLLFGDKITENKEHLNALDTAIGDGDHGSNLTRGATALREELAKNNYDNLFDIFSNVGMTWVSQVGGASGPLYGSAFISMARAANENENLAEILSAGLEGIQKRGKAEVGEKTMVDEWAPVVLSLQSNTLSEEIIEDSLQKTKDMKATKGRASYLGDRSIGHIDPGAQSSAYFFQAMLESGVTDD